MSAAKSRCDPKLRKSLEKSKSKVSPSVLFIDVPATRFLIVTPVETLAWPVMEKLLKREQVNLLAECTDICTFASKCFSILINGLINFVLNI